jgi:hypothetical protein
MGEICAWGDLFHNAAVRWHPPFQAYYQQLIQKGKARKVALIACAHKLLRIMNAMMRQQVAFKPQIQHQKKIKKQLCSFRAFKKKLAFRKRDLKC